MRLIRYASYIKEGGELVVDVFYACFPTVVALEQVSEARGVDDGEPQLYTLLLDVLNERPKCSYLRIAIYGGLRLRERELTAQRSNSNEFSELMINVLHSIH